MDWFNDAVHVIIDGRVHRWAAEHGKSAATLFLSDVRDQVAALLTRSLPLGRRWELLCPKLKSGLLPTSVRNLDYTVSYLRTDLQPSPWTWGFSEDLMGIPVGADNPHAIKELKDLFKSGLAPRMELLYFRMASEKPFLGTVVAIKSVLQVDSRLGGLTVIVSL